MIRGIVKISDLIPEINFAKPPEDKSPIPKPPKVVGDPTREPVNLQAALVIRKANWLEKPLPPEPAPVGETNRIKSENATLRTINAQIANENGALRRKNESQSKRIAELEKKVSVLLKSRAPAPNHTAPSPSFKAKILERLSNG